MALIVEDGTIVEDANAYIDEAFADLYWLGQSAADNAAWVLLTSAEKETAITRATQRLDKIILWFGQILDSEQELSWPRIGVCDCEGRTVPQDTVPDGVKNATAILALFLHNQASASVLQTYNDTRSARVQRVQGEDVEIEYFESEYLTNRDSDDYPVQIFMELKCYTSSGLTNRRSGAMPLTMG